MLYMSGESDQSFRANKPRYMFTIDGEKSVIRGGKKTTVTKLAIKTVIITVNR